MAEPNETNEANEMPEDLGRLKKALTAERGNHKAVRAELKALQARLTEMESLGVNPNAATVKKFIDSSVQAGIAAGTTELQGKIVALESLLGQSQKVAEEANASLASRAIAEELREAARNQHVKPEALGDVIAIGATELKLIDGEVRTADGLSATDWVEARKQSSPFWWPPSRGSGARGSSDGPVVTLDNPFAKETFSLTKQSQITLQDPSRAERLQREAAAMSRQ